MTFREQQDDGTVIITGAIPPAAGGGAPTTANVVSYQGSAGLQSTNVEAALDELDAEKAPNVHTHDDRYYTELEVTNLLAQKASTGHNHDGTYSPVGHTHDNLYFTEVEVTNLLAGKSDVGHNHDTRYYTEQEVDAKIAAALATTAMHNNPGFDIVEINTDGSGEDVVAPRPYPIGWDNFWGNGTGADRPQLEAVQTDTRLGTGWAFKMHLPTTASGQSCQPAAFSAPPGSLVQFEAWVKGNGPRAMLSLYTNKDVDPGFFVGGNAGIDSQAVVPGAEYQRLAVSFVLPSDHNRVRLMIRGYTGSPGAPGTLWWDDTKSSMQIIPPSGVVTGEIKAWPTATAPSGYLLCNGGTFSSVDYPALAALLGDTFGTHSGTTYYLPDFRGRSPMGIGQQVPQQEASFNLSMGQKHGDTRLQGHTHGVSATTGGQSSSHYHGDATSGGSGILQSGSGGYANLSLGGGSYALNNTSWASHDHTHYFSTTSASHNLAQGGSGNVHPVLGINFIIKAA